MTSTNLTARWSDRLKRLRANWDRAVFFLLPVCLLVFALHKIVAYDFWWQLKTGAWVLAHGFPDTDPFSFAWPNRTWIEMRWLYCVAIHVIFKYFGLNFLILAKAALLLLTFGLLWRLNPQGKRWAINLGLVCVLVLTHQRFTIRPELVTFLLLTVTLLCLFRYKNSGSVRWLYALPLMQVLWVNSHTLFIFGPVVLWLFAFSELIAAKLPILSFRQEEQRLKGERLRAVFIVAALVILACLINPYFVKGALFPLQLYTEIQAGHVMSELITELKSPFALAAFSLSFTSYLCVMMISALGFWLNRRRVAFSLLVLWLAFLYLSVMAERNLPLFGIVAGISVMLNYSAFEEIIFSHVSLRAIVAWSARIVAALFVLTMIPAVATDVYYRSIDPDRRFGFGVAERRFPIKALAFVRAENLPTPVFGSLGEGGYILFEGGPKSVFVDGRLEVYGGEIVKTAVKMVQTGEGLIAALQRLNIQTVVVRHDRETTLFQVLNAQRDFVPVYYDSSHVVYLRISPQTQAQVERLRLDWKNPVERAVQTPPELRAPDWLAHLWPKVADNAEAQALGQLFLTVGNFAKAQSYFEESVALRPDDDRANLHLGVLYRAFGREAEAASLLSKVPAEMWNQREAQSFAASVYEATNNHAAAIGAYQQLLALGERSAPVYQRLARAAMATNRFDIAASALRELSAIYPNDAQNWNNLALLAAKQGQSQQALQYLNQSLQINPNQPAAHNQIGIIQLEMGNAAAARYSFNRALSLDPNYQPARQNLERLNSAP